MKLKIKGNVWSGLVRAAAFLTMAPTQPLLCCQPASQRTAAVRVFFSDTNLKADYSFPNTARFSLCAVLILFWLELMNREGFAFSSLFCFFARALLLLNGYEIENLACVPRHVNLITLALFSCWLSLSLPLFSGKP
jgi:hypothetical protein